MSLSRANADAAAMVDSSEVASVETGTSWLVASAALFILTFSYGAPLVSSVALKPISADLGSARSVPALANSLVWMGSGLGAIGLGWVAERIGFRSTAAFGAVMIGCGLALSASGGTWSLVIGHGMLIGLLGSGAINVPLIVYVSRWFDRRRGSALALVSSGQYIAGAIWPSIIALGTERIGWRSTMLAFGAATTLAIVPAAILCLRPPPEEPMPGPVVAGRGVAGGDQVLGLSPAVAFTWLCVAGFLCCVPMAMPSGHVVALCSDLGIGPPRKVP